MKIKSICRQFNLRYASAVSSLIGLRLAGSATFAACLLMTSANAQNIGVEAQEIDWAQMSLVQTESDLEGFFTEFDRRNAGFAAVKGKIKQQVDEQVVVVAELAAEIPKPMYCNGYLVNLIL